MKKATKVTRCRDCFGIIGGCTIFFDKGEDSQPHCKSFMSNTAALTEEQKDDAVAAMKSMKGMCVTPDSISNILGKVIDKLNKDAKKFEEENDNGR